MPAPTVRCLLHQRLENMLHQRLGECSNTGWENAPTPAVRGITPAVRGAGRLCVEQAVHGAGCAWSRTGMPLYRPSYPACRTVLSSCRTVSLSGWATVQEWRDCCVHRAPRCAVRERIGHRALALPPSLGGRHSSSLLLSSLSGRARLCAAVLHA